MFKTKLVYRHFIYCLRVPPEEMVGGRPVSDVRRGWPRACVSRRCGNVRDGQVKIRQIKRTIKTKGKSETKRKKRKGSERIIGCGDERSKFVCLRRVKRFRVITVNKYPGLSELFPQPQSPAIITILCHNASVVAR